MNPAEHKEQVRKFYRIIWNNRNLDAIPSVLHENVTFRGSLGQQKRGHRGFAEYVDMVHKALGDYQCTIEDMVAENRQVFARMSFGGIHRGIFMGYAPSHRQVTWVGCALFSFEDGRISDCWVLGDLQALAKQLQDKTPL